MALTSRQQVLVFIAAAFIVDYIPLINLPFLWSETFFHEISHGLAAILTGGTIHNIRLNFNGSGLCTTSGGLPLLVTFSGYAGSALWGLLIYSIATAVSQTRAKYIVATIAILLGVTLLLWARNLSTIIILIVLLAMYSMPLIKSFSIKWFSLPGINVKSFTQLVGIFVMLDAIRSPLYLLGGRNLGDSAALAELTWLPEIFWVALWFAIAVSCLYLLWTSTALKSQGEGTT